MTDRLPVRGKMALGIGLVLALALGSCGKESATAPDPDPITGYSAATTGADGAAVVQNADGATVLEVVAYDEAGNPLSGLAVDYLAASPNPLVAFTQAATGAAAGTFELVAPTALRAADDAHAIAVVILNLLDPQRGRLYDPERDGFSPTRNTNLAEIRQVLDLETLTAIIETTPGFAEPRECTRTQLGALIEHYNTMIGFERGYSHEPGSEPRLLAERLTRVALFAQNQHASYRYRLYLDQRQHACFMVPLGVTATINIDTPANGASFLDTAQRRQSLAGRVALPPEVVTADGGKVELWANGHLMSGALGVGGDGSGAGSAFNTLAPLQLALGQNTLRVLVYVNEVNRGLANGVNGEAGEASVTVDYEEPPSGPSAPVMTNIVYPTDFPCPDSQVPISFHFVDRDGDVEIAHEVANWSIRGVPGDYDRTASVHYQSNLECFTQIESDCTINLSYGDLTGGDWIHWEFWVVDGTGRESNHLELQMDIVGDCDGVRALRSGTPFTGAIDQ
jgi:hypothetical protein